MKKIFILLVVASCLRGASAMEQAFNPEALRAAEQQAAQEIQKIVDENRGNQDALKLSLVGRIRQLGGEIFGENAKELVEISQFLLARTN